MWPKRTTETRLRGAAEYPQAIERNGMTEQNRQYIVLDIQSFHKKMTWKEALKSAREQAKEYPGYEYVILALVSRHTQTITGTKMEENLI